MSSSSSSSSGIGLFGALFILFLALKLTGVEPVAAWSWWWVTAPLWGGFVAIFVILFVAVCWGLVVGGGKRT